MREYNILPKKELHRSLSALAHHALSTSSSPALALSWSNRSWHDALGEALLIPALGLSMFDAVVSPGGRLGLLGLLQSSWDVAVAQAVDTINCRGFEATNPPEGSGVEPTPLP